MLNPDFLLKSRVAEIEQQFIDKGWITIYQYPSSEGSDMIYCCLVKDQFLQNYLEDRDWQIEPGREGKPSVYATFDNEIDGDTYQTYNNENIEPFIFHKSFKRGEVRYVDLSEEFILYWRLYEELTDKENRTYTFFDDYGESEIAVIVTPNTMQVKYKFLIEYISLRKMNLAIVFDFERWSSGTMEDNSASVINKDIESENTFYNHIIRYCEDSRGNTVESWIRGKTIIRNQPAVKSYHGLTENEVSEKFIIGIDKFGAEILQEPTSDAAFMLTIVCFSRQVLDKYYNDPSKYEVDGFGIKFPAFSMKIDNNGKDQITVFLKDLSILPHKEQLHWKQYNIIPPERGALSVPFYEVMIMGSWAKQVGRADNYFKSEYHNFNTKWQEKFGWPFYLPLKGTDENLFISLHLPSTDNIKTFCEQILILVKLTIDSLNEAKLSEEIELEDGDKGINKIEKYLIYKNHALPKMILFLKHLQNLRSGLAAHRFSENNSRTKQAMEYFKINEGAYIQAAEEIFIKSVFTFNSLTNAFLINEIDPE